MTPFLSESDVTIVEFFRFFLDMTRCVCNIFSVSTKYKHQEHSLQGNVQIWPVWSKKYQCFLNLALLIIPYIAYNSSYLVRLPKFTLDNNSFYSYFCCWAKRMHKLFCKNGWRCTNYRCTNKLLENERYKIYSNPGISSSNTLQPTKLYKMMLILCIFVSLLLLTDW